MSISPCPFLSGDRLDRVASVFLKHTQWEDSRVGQGQRVLADIKCIRAALTEQGDRLQKLPRQAIWMIHRSNGKTYQLTYQPAPFNTWALHPPDSEASQLLGVINHALNRQSPARTHEAATTYHQQLHPWCIIQLLPQMQWRVVARFRRRNDAEAHMRVLRQQTLAMQYTLVFDPSSDQPALACLIHPQI